MMVATPGSPAANARARAVAATMGMASGKATRLRRLLAALVACWMTTTAARVVAADLLVRTEQGLVRGEETETGRRFLGIPYAAPPVGALRWQPPQPPFQWRGVRDATRFGDHCAELGGVVGTASATEDCLFLNVYAPEEGGAGSERDADRQGQNPRQGRAVMLWIHGGALVSGESDDFDAGRLVELGGVIVVTINYRLGTLGFLAHAALTAESPARASGNYGIMDQQAALQWVRRNIAAFGGDPGNVTIFGQSAGGLTVLANLGSPGAADLFHRAIVQSGAYELVLPSLADGEAEGARFAERAGCADQTSHCLRSLSVDEILAHQSFATPVVDGKVLPLSLDVAGATGMFNRVPVIHGTNHDEARFMVAMGELAGQSVTAGDYAGTLDAVFGVKLGPLVLAQYPLANYANADEALAASQTDSAFACPARLADQLLSRFVPVFAFEFNDEGAPEIFLPPVSFPYGAAHQSELQYLFPADDLRHIPGSPPALDEDQRDLSSTMIGYWTHFAKSGDPNANGTGPWPSYNASTDEFQSMVPSAPITEAGFADSHKCQFWDEVLLH
jgi:para-nitrobenzyl esterase